MYTWRIHISGLVQGVGFRPLVYKKARANKLKGEVNNGVDGLTICFNASQHKAETFYEEILRLKPPLSRISQSSLTKTKQKGFDNFRIVESQRTGTKSVLFAPDYALCMTCRKEMTDKKNRRYGYPFITCTQCGPRYSIMVDLPYDRAYTSMEAFEMCKACEQEYQSPDNCRHYSQTNSCQSCGVQLELKSKDPHLPNLSDLNLVRSKIHSYWRSGAIVAIKGIGGFLLTCDAHNRESIRNLRKRKERPFKPLALMYPSVDALGAYELSAKELEELEGECSPILLLKKTGENELPDTIAGALPELGIMIPNAPVYEFLLSSYHNPIVATSANISNSPIIFQDEEEDELYQIADHILTNNRVILLPQDDSVIRFSQKYKQRIVIRRSRGIAPNTFLPNLDLPETCVLAFGADLKATFSLLHQGNIYTSQYLGDLNHYDTQQNFVQVLNHIQRVLHAHPTWVLHDFHPDYSSSRIARQFAKDFSIPKASFQHHQAHFAAVLAENNLLDSSGILGVIWDGTGLGTDGHIWGGEFFTFIDKKIDRMAHFTNFPSISGDKMALEPRLSALAMLPKAEQARKKFSTQELKIFDHLISKSELFTSSMGRIFDAVASLLGLCDVQTYEGEAAMKLEAYARRYVGDSLAFKDRYEVTFENNQIHSHDLLEKILSDLNQEKESAYIAAKFHNTLPEIIKRVANKLKITKIAVSGGVFQNALLVDLLIKQLGDNFELFFHKQLSPNDENVSFGQLVLHVIKYPSL